MLTSGDQHLTRKHSFSTYVIKQQISSSMDLAAHKLYSNLSSTKSPSTTTTISSSLHTSHTSFPIIAVAVIGILATAFLLVSYYIFVIKCCLNWHRIDLLRRFSFSRRRAAEDQLMAYSPTVDNRGLNEAAIRSIPVFKFKKSNAENEQKDSCECAVCLNEFVEGEKLRAIPNCCHVFHIDCIDIWLQNNANCPLCRTSISAARPDVRMPMDRVFGPGPSPQDRSLVPAGDSFTGRDEDYVVIEIGLEQGGRPLTNPSHEGTSSNELLSISPSPRKLERRVSRKKAKKLSHVSSMGDECIDNRRKDERFVVQPIRRSFSMDSAADSQLYLAVQDIIQRHGQVNNEINQSEGCCSRSNSRGKRSFFSFGQGRGSRNTAAVQPVELG